MIGISGGVYLGQANPRQVDVPLLQVDVQATQATDAHLFIFKVKIGVTGQPVRWARPREVECRIREMDGEKAGPILFRAESGPYDVLVVNAYPRLKVGHYAATAYHKESGAEYGFKFDILADGGPARNWSGRGVFTVGKEMPFGYAQVSMAQGRPTPTGIAYPEVRQWTRYGPSIGLPGRQFLVRQSPETAVDINELLGPGRRQTFV